MIQDEIARARERAYSGPLLALGGRRLPRDSRRVGVVVHHVASVYPLEIERAQKLAAGGAPTEVTWDAVHGMNAGHAREHDRVTRDEAVSPAPASRYGTITADGATSSRS